MVAKNRAATQAEDGASNDAWAVFKHHLKKDGLQAALQALKVMSRDKTISVWERGAASGLAIQMRLFYLALGPWPRTSTPAR